MILGCFMAATGMALPCRASYGIFTLYHKAENGSIPCPDAERVQQEDEAEEIKVTASAFP